MDPGTGILVATILGALLPPGIELGKKIWNHFFGQEKSSGDPYAFDDDDLKALSQLPPEQRKQVEGITNMLSQQYMQSINEPFNPKIDKEGLMQAMQMSPLSAEQLQFPQQNQNFINDLMQSTDFAPIKDEVMRQYHQEIIPQTLERLTGLGQTGRSSAFGAGLGRAAQNVATQLGALGSQYGLQRAQTLGNLGQRQEELGYKRAGLMHKLNQDRQNQAFRQAESLANIGIQEKQLGLQHSGQQQQQYGNLLQMLQPAVYPAQPSAFSQALGSGISNLGQGMGAYGSYLNQKALIDALATKPGGG